MVCQVIRLHAACLLCAVRPIDPGRLGGAALGRRAHAERVVRAVVAGQPGDAWHCSQPEGCGQRPSVRGPRPGAPLVDDRCRQEARSRRLRLLSSASREADVLPKSAGLCSIGGPPACRAMLPSLAAQRAGAAPSWPKAHDLPRYSCSVLSHLGQPRCRASSSLRYTPCWRTGYRPRSAPAPSASPPAACTWGQVRCARLAVPPPGAAFLLWSLRPERLAMQLRVLLNCPATLCCAVSTPPCCLLVSAVAVSVCAQTNHAPCPRVQLLRCWCCRRWRPPTGRTSCCGWSASWGWHGWRSGASPSAGEGRQRSAAALHAARFGARLARFQSRVHAWSRVPLLYLQAGPKATLPLCAITACSTVCAARPLPAPCRCMIPAAAGWAPAKAAARGMLERGDPWPRPGAASCRTRQARGGALHT